MKKRVINYAKRLALLIGTSILATVFNEVFTIFLFFGGAILFIPVITVTGDDWLRSASHLLGVGGGELWQLKTLSALVTALIFIPILLMVMNYFSWRERSMRNTVLNIAECLVPFLLLGALLSLASDSRVAREHEFRIQNAREILAFCTDEYKPKLIRPEQREEMYNLTQRISNERNAFMEVLNGRYSQEDFYRVTARFAGQRDDVYGVEFANENPIYREAFGSDFDLSNTDWIEERALPFYASLLRKNNHIGEQDRYEVELREFQQECDDARTLLTAQSGL